MISVVKSVSIQIPPVFRQRLSLGTRKVEKVSKVSKPNQPKIKKRCADGNSLAVQWVGIAMACVQSLVGELRSHKPHGKAKKKGHAEICSYCDLVEFLWGNFPGKIDAATGLRIESWSCEESQLLGKKLVWELCLQSKWR